MKHECYICGEEHNEIDMMPVNYGRVRWLCWACWKNGQYQVAKNEIRRATAINKAKQKRGDR